MFASQQLSIRYALTVGSLALLAACDTPRLTSANALVDRGTRVVERSGGAFAFTELESSNTCTVAGGDSLNPFVLPSGYAQTVIAKEPAFADALDMNTQNETGPQRGRYLYHPSEGSVSEVSVTDLETGITKQLAFRPDWESMDLVAWTPWGTVLVGEEANVQSKPDPNYPGAIGGLVYEIFLNPGDLMMADSVVARPALGSKSHEGTRIDQQGNVYGISESNPGFLYKFVPDVKGNLSSGQLYALKVVNATGDRVGEAEWIQLDRAAVQVDARQVALDSGATGYNRPEDLEIATSSGNNRGGNNVLYVAVTGKASPADNRVIAIDLREPAAGALKATAFVYDYVKIGVNTTSEFEMPDNLALDQQGNLYIAEDPGGSFPSKTKGDDIWVAAPAGGLRSAASSVRRFASLTDCSAEPTGLYFDLRSDRLFVNVQHRGGDGKDLLMAIDRAP